MKEMKTIKYCNLNRLNRDGARLIMCGFFLICGMSGSVNADCITDPSDPSVFALQIDATSNCSNMSANMSGCTIDETGSCVITGPDGNSITVSIDSGGVGSNIPINWSTDSPFGNGIDFAIVGGAANGSSTCGYSYTPGSNIGVGLIFEKSNGLNQKVTSISFCSDFIDPAPEVIAETCPENFQNAVNQLSKQTGLDFAFLLDPNQAGRSSLCAPNGLDANGNPDPTIATTIRVRCVDECITKPECDPGFPGYPASCTFPVCETSGSWNLYDEQGACIADAPTPISTDPAPFCWEIQQDLDGKCSTSNSWEPQEQTTLEVKKGHVNPFVYQSCYNSGGRYVCETMCFLYPGETAAACPPGSTVF